MYVELNAAGDKINAVGWYGSETPDRCRRVGGGRFTKPANGTPAFWAYPLTMETCRALRREFGDLLDIGPRLSTWARDARKHEAYIAAAKVDGGVRLRYVPLYAGVLDEATATRPYQRTAAAYGAAVGSFLLADEQGLGKTIETLATIIEGQPEGGWHLLVSPSVAVESVWAPEVRRWLRDANVAVLPLTGTLAHRSELLRSFNPGNARHVFVVTNIEAARIRPSENPRTGRMDVFLTKDALVPELHSRIWSTVVVDECQRALIRTNGKPNQTRAGFKVLSKNSERRIALSGTPMRGKPEQLWGTLNWLRPDVYTSYWKWVERYFHLDSNGFSNYVLGGWQEDGKERMAADLASIMLRRTKAEVLPELPPKTYGGSLLDPLYEDSPVGIWLEPSETQKRQQAELEENGLLKGDDGAEVLVNGTLANYTRQKQIADGFAVIKGGLYPTLASPKYKWLVDFLAELDGAKVVVASQFTQVVNAWARGLRDLGYSVSVLTGETTQAKRTAMVKQFQETDEVQVFILNTKAGGVALTLDAADYMVLVDETTIPDDQAQVEDRIHRTSRIHSTFIYYLRTLGTLDEEVAWVSAARADVQRYLLDGSRGVKFARAMFHNNKKGAK